MRPPQLFIGNLVDSFPDALVGRVAHPLAAEIAIEDELNVRRQPGARMNAIGHMADRHLIGRHLRPEVVPHFSRDIAVQPTDAVDAIGQTDRKHGHREALLAISHVLAP